MCCDYYVWDRENEQFINTHFATFEGAETWVEINGGFEKYDIFEKLT